MAQLKNATLSIHRCSGNTGEWRLSKQVIGKRGGKSWQTIFSTPSTGGEWRGQLEVGTRYKVTFWDNGWPESGEFTA